MSSAVGRNHASDDHDKEHGDDRDAPALRAERHSTLPLKTPRGGARRTIREPQPAFAHSSTMRRPTGAHRCHAYEPSCDLQRAPRCGGAASLPSVRKRCILLVTDWDEEDIVAAARRLGTTITFG